jgi:chromosome segregation ATPase
MKKSHKYDVRYLNNQLLKQKKDLESKINKKEEKYKQLQDKLSSAETINKGLKNDNDKKNKEIINLKKDKDEINKKLDTIHCRVLSKTIIDFLYYVFTSNFKDNTYKEEKNTIIKEIEKKKGRGI